jgi:hypothetical protein
MIVANVGGIVPEIDVAITNLIPWIVPSISPGEIELEVQAERAKKGARRGSLNHMASGHGNLDATEVIAQPVPIHALADEIWTLCTTAPQAP